MKTIEYHIKQEKLFSSERRKLIVNLIYTSHRIAKEMDNFFSKFGITHKQYNVLRIIRGAKVHVSTSYIKDRMLVKNADVSRLVDRLCVKGTLIKREDATDKRLISIQLTEEGKQLMNLISHEIEEIDKITAFLTPGECKQLNQLLNKVNN